MTSEKELKSEIKRIENIDIKKVTYGKEFEKAIDEQEILPQMKAELRGRQEARKELIEMIDEIDFIKEMRVPTNIGIRILIKDKLKDIKKQ
jgi:hypothetical protein